MSKSLLPDASSPVTVSVELDGWASNCLAIRTSTSNVWPFNLVTATVRVEGKSRGGFPNQEHPRNGDSQRLGLYQEAFQIVIPGGQAH